MYKDINNIVYNDFQILIFLKIHVCLREYKENFRKNLFVCINLLYVYILII